MNLKELVTGVSGDKQFLLGNEAAVRGVIEDFFKAAKEAFGLGKFHSFTNKSMYKNIYLCLLLITFYKLHRLVKYFNKKNT